MINGSISCGNRSRSVVFIRIIWCTNRGLSSICHSLVYVAAGICLTSQKITFCIVVFNNYIALNLSVDIGHFKRCTSDNLSSITIFSCRIGLDFFQSVNLAIFCNCFWLIAFISRIVSSTWLSVFFIHDRIFQRCTRSIVKNVVDLHIASFFIDVGYLRCAFNDSTCFARKTITNFHFRTSWFDVVNIACTIFNNLLWFVAFITCIVGITNVTIIYIHFLLCNSLTIGILIVNHHITSYKLIIVGHFSCSWSDFSSWITVCQVRNKFVGFAIFRNSWRHFTFALCIVITTC
ncbi:Uncharacterised protein [Streptococcus suis]|uniref:Uncharacterized protein n=1 Tax=Streptococcus suis TaxID=1307 RepID=A0A0Z8H4V4_STRSU|nr:Uncharacterised protein [Streptococcus suis]